jgi:hypothetical protein
MLSAGKRKLGEGQLMRYFNRGARVALLVALAAAAAIAVPTSSAGSEPVSTGELRAADAVPLGKSDAEFGKIVRTPGKLTPPSTPLAVRLRASGAPKLGQAFTVELQVHAYEAAPGTTTTILLPPGAQVVSGSTTGHLDLAKGQTGSVSVVAKLTRGGQVAIEGSARRALGAGQSWGDLDQLFFTVGRSDSMVGLQEASTGELTAGRLPGEAPLPASASAGAPGPRAAATWSVCWKYVNRSGGQSPLRDALVYLIDADNGPHDLIAQTFTNANGCATFNGNNTDGDEGGVVDPYTQFQTQRAGRYRVENYGGGVYFCNNPAVANRGSGSLGNWFCGGTTGDGRSLNLYDDAYRARRFIEEHRQGQGTPAGSCTIRWQTGGTDGTYYTTTDSKVHLADANVRSADITVHECSHRQMHVLYGNFPRTDCPSPHFLTGISGKICAWTEGWTYVLTAGVGGEPNYMFDNGSLLNLETANCNTANWSDGPKVEARVGGVLIDLMDPFTNSYGPVTGFSNEGPSCGGRDAVSGQFPRIWDLFSDQNDQVLVAQEGNIDSYSRAWRARAGAGYPIDPAWNAGKVNSIATFTRD